MTVYVDDMNVPADVQNGSRVVRGRWSHLMADTTEELLAMADRIGLQRRWLQHAGLPTEHFDVTLSRRTAAVRAGAVQIAYGPSEGGLLTWAKRVGIPFDLALVRSDPEAFRARLRNAEPDAAVVAAARAHLASMCHHVGPHQMPRVAQQLHGRRTYTCGLQAGHDGPHGWGALSWAGEA